MISAVVYSVQCSEQTVPFTNGIYNYIFTNKCSVYGSERTYRNIVIFVRVAHWTIRNLAYNFGEPNECVPYCWYFWLSNNPHSLFKRKFISKIYCLDMWWICASVVVYPYICGACGWHSHGTCARRFSRSAMPSG